MEPSRTDRAICDILLIQDRCIALCHVLKDCFQIEREALIHLKLEGLLETNGRKEDVSRQLVGQKKAMHCLLQNVFGLSDSQGFEDLLTGEQRDAWLMKRAQWLKIWEQTRDWCEANQRFMNHSLRNLSILEENLKRLFGEPTTYSPKGMKIESKTQGKVVEARY